MPAIGALFWLAFLPIQILLLLLFILSDSLHILVSRLTSKTVDPTERDFSDPVCSLVVLNWNGRHLLEESLPALMRAVRFTGKNHEIIVVDNGSSDDSLTWLQENYPEVRLIPLEKNLGFGEGNNRGVEAASHEITVLLNNDMIVEKDFLPPLLQAFVDPDVFAVSSQIFFPLDKLRQETGNTLVRFRWGYPYFSHEPIQKLHYFRKYVPVLWAGGGSSAFHRRRFLALGGFSPLFNPCYFEDTDLSHRAWRRGWKVLLATHSRVLHKHRSSTEVRFSPSQLATLMEVRKLWYVWRNYEYFTLLSHLLFLPFRFYKSSLFFTYLHAIQKIPWILWQRIQEPQRKISENRLFHWIQRSYTDHIHFSSPQPWTKSSSLRILIVSAYLPRLGHHGGGNRVFHLIQEVSKKHEVSVYSFVETQEEAASASSLLPFCKRVETVRRRHFTPVSVFPYEPFEEFNCPDFRESLEAFLVEEDFDLVHFEWPQMAQYGDLFPDTPRLLTEVEVNYAAHCTFLKLERNPLLKVGKFYNSLQTFYREVEMCRKVNQVICVTEDDRNYLQGYIEKEKLKVVNTGVDTEYFNNNDSYFPEEGSLVFVGAFRHQPNVDAMFYFCREIFPLILKEQPQTHLYIVGSTPPDRVCQLGSHSRVTVTGYVKDIRDFYRKGQIVIVPLRAGVGIRGKILEGWASGTAIVATPLACQGLRAVHGENILIAEDAQEFALWTLALLRDSYFCHRLGQAGRQTARQYYDWKDIGKQMIELYERTALKNTNSIN